MFKRKDPQDLFGSTDFTVTNTIFEGPALSLLPSIFQDSQNRRWAVVYRGAEPALFDYADVIDCLLVEDGSIDVKAEQNKKELFEQILANPARVSRASAGANEDMCAGVSLVIRARSAATEQGEAQLVIPVITRPVRKTSATYKHLLQYGRDMRDAFLAMRDEAGMRAARS